MAERRLGAPKLSSKPAAPLSTPKLGGKLTPYVPRGAQYDYNPPSVFERYKILTAVFAILLVTAFGYWAFILRQPRATIQPAQHTQLSVPGAPTQPPSDPVYIEPLKPR